LLTGDRILGAQEQRPISELDLRVLLESHAGQPVDLVIGRETDEIELAVTPHDVGGKGKIGVSFLLAEGLHVDLTWSEAARESLQANLVLSRTLFVVLKRLVTAEVPLSTTVSGPIGIAQFSRQALTQGFDQFLYLLGFFSLQLGILNLLPIPVLDGGHILILGIEAVMRRELSEKLKERVMQVGFVFLLAFMGLVIFFDIAKIIP
jgi:regulator of sigma E protease